MPTEGVLHPPGARRRECLSIRVEPRKRVVADRHTMSVVLAIDAGTTSVRARALNLNDPSGSTDVWAQRELTQFFPAPDRVEHDALEIWRLVVETVSDVWEQCGRPAIATIGITNQRETVVAWDRSTGRPYGRAIVWQDRRTAARCTDLRQQGLEPLIRERTGLVLDPYFSGSKMQWLLDEGGVPRNSDLAVGTVDTWIVWNLTGGAVLATDPSNASRTMLFGLESNDWDPELLDLFAVPRNALGDIRPSSGRFGLTAVGCGLPAGIPISGVAGDQQAALFGQGCVDVGMAKNTYGTGSFVLMNVGHTPPPVAAGLVTTVAWQLRDGTVTYALEGSVFSSGSAIQWLRDGLGIMEHASETGPLASSVASSDGVVIVPAFNGLGSPWWDPYARGLIIGITRGTTRAHMARAVVDAMALQTTDVLDAMIQASGASLHELRVDGGASTMDVLLELQAALAGVPVRRPKDLESTSRGAAHLAALAEDLWAPSLPSLPSSGFVADSDSVFHPGDSTLGPGDLAALQQQWRRALARCRAWATPT